MSQAGRDRPATTANPSPAIDWRFTTADAWDRSIRIDHPKRRETMRGVLLWAVGIPIPVIILLYLFHVI
ncbi:hypothetical protein [Aliidongia sp.]|uniref:hypothetical protein n=1 Tax=Aliidongia sp. TaxID=1914230 RepID=UPI002DDDA128|nr:hypothetical protein [Aliidongia sp.]